MLENDITFDVRKNITAIHMMSLVQTISWCAYKKQKNNKKLLKKLPNLSLNIIINLINVQYNTYYIYYIINAVGSFVHTAHYMLLCKIKPSIYI